MHHVFLTRYGVYLLAFDMREALGNPEQAVSNLKCWLNSVELHAPDAPVVLVVSFSYVFSISPLYLKWVSSYRVHSLTTLKTKTN